MPGKYLCQGACSAGRVLVGMDPDVCSVCKIAVTGVTPLRFGVILNHLLQVPRRNMDIGSKKM